MKVPNWLWSICRRRKHFAMAVCSHWVRLGQRKVVREDRMHLIPATKDGVRFILEDIRRRLTYEPKLSRFTAGAFLTKFDMSQLTPHDFAVGYRLAPWDKRKDALEMIRELDGLVRSFAAAQ